MQWKTKKRLNLFKGLHKNTRILMKEIHEITENFRTRNILYNFPMIARELKKNPDSRKDYSEISNVFTAARSIAKEVLKSMSRVFIDKNGKRTHKFIDLKGIVLTIQQAEQQFVELLNIYKIPYEYFDFVQGTLIPMTSFVVKESIDQDRIRKVAFAVETVIEDMAITNEMIQITGKTAAESLLPIKDIHQKYLIDGLTPKKSKKNIWEKELSKKQRAEGLDKEMHEYEKRLMELKKEKMKLTNQILKDEVENNRENNKTEDSHKIVSFVEKRDGSSKEGAAIYKKEKNNT